MGMAPNPEDSISQLAQSLGLAKGVTRVTLVDDVSGRVYEQWNVSVEVQLQDGGRTLKVFVKHLAMEEPVDPAFD